MHDSLIHTQTFQTARAIGKSCAFLISPLRPSSRREAWVGGTKGSLPPCPIRAGPAARLRGRLAEGENVSEEKKQDGSCDRDLRTLMDTAVETEVVKVFTFFLHLK